MHYLEKQSGVLVPFDFREAEQGRPIYREVASTGDGRDITKPWVQQLELEPFEDPVLTDRLCSDLARYEAVMGDDQVKSCMQQRIFAVVHTETEVEPGGTRAVDKAAAKWLEETLDALDWDKSTNLMLLNEIYGYGVAELMYRPDGRFVALDAIKVRRARRFRFDPDGRLRLLTMQDQLRGEVLPPRKFWTYTSGADNDDSRYGKGLGHWLYWPTYFKRNGLKFWLVFLEKFGMPTAMAKLPDGKAADLGERKKALEVLRAIQGDSGVVVPEGFVVELIEAARAGTAGYERLYDRMDAAISKILLSQTMTTDDGSSLSQAKVHQEVAQSVVKAAADLICNSFNCGPVRWLTGWNFPGAKPPRVWRRVEDEPDLKPLAERDQIIVNMGFEPTEQYVRDTYGGDWTKKQPLDMSGMGYIPGQPGQGGQPGQSDGQGEGPEFAEPAAVRRSARDHRDDQEAIVRAATQAAQQYQAMLGPRVNQLLGMLEETRDLATFRERLQDLIETAEPPPEAIRAMAQATTAARLLGHHRGQRQTAGTDGGEG